MGGPGNMWSSVRSRVSGFGFGPGGQLVVSSILLVGFLAVIWTLREPAELRQRRAELLSATPAKRQEWIARWREFEGLSEEERARLWTLYREFADQPDRADLLDTLRAYEQWLALLPAPQRAEIRAMPADQRLAKIKEKLDKSALDRFLVLSEKRFTQEDHQVTCEWLNELVARRQKLLEKTFAHWNNIPQRLRPFVFYTTLRASLGEGRPGRGRYVRSHRLRPETVAQLKVTDEEIDALAQRLSESARSYLEQAASPQAKRELIYSWVRAVMVARFFRPTPAQLQDFMKTLPADVQSRLERMPRREEMMAELRRMYMRAQFRPRGQPSLDERGRRVGPPFGPPGRRGPRPPRTPDGRPKSSLP